MTRDARGPLDLLLVYITPSHHGVGQRLKLETIDKRLGVLPLRPVLRLLAIIAHRADRSFGDRSERLALAEALIRPGPARNKAISLIKHGPHAAVGSQAVLMLGQRALVQCPDVDTTTDDVELGYRLGELLMALGDYLGSRSLHRDELILEVVRVGLFYRLHGVLDWYTAAHGVFFDTLPLMIDDPDFVDVDALLQAELGISLDQYWMVSAALGIVGVGEQRLQVYPKEIGRLPAEVTDAFFATQMQSIDDARGLAAKEIATGSPWALRTFFLRPILANVLPEGGYPMRSHFLTLKSTLMGMHYLVQDLQARRGSESSLAWSRLLGRAVERYGRSLLETLLGDSSTLSSPESERSAGSALPPACDFFVDEGTAVISGDFVHRALTLATQTTGGPDALERDLLLAIIEKVDQIEMTLADKNPTANRIYPVIVMSGPLPMNPTLASKIDQLLAKKPRKFIGTDDRCRHVAVLELYELRLLLLTASADGRLVSDVLEFWLSSPLGLNSFHDWLATQSDVTVSRGDEDERWEEALNELLFDAAAVDQDD